MSTYQRFHERAGSFNFCQRSGRAAVAGDLKTPELFTAHATLIKIVDFIIGAILGATMAHFVVDAGRGD